MPMYKRTPAPAPPTKGYLDAELQRVQRGIHGVMSRTLTDSFSPLGTDDLILVDPTGGPIVITLPVASTMLDVQWTFKRTTGAGNAITFDGLIDGVSFRTLPNQWDALTIQSDGVAYYIIAQVP